MEEVTESIRKKQKAETRARIVKEAMSVFEQKGFIGATTPDIAKAAGVSHGSVFAHFNSREELLTEVVESFLGQADRETRKSIKTCGSVREVLSSHLQAIEPYERLYASLIRESAMLPKRLRALFIEINSAVASHIIDALDRSGYQALPKSKRYFVFNVWFGTISHYLLNRDLFAARGSVLEQHGDQIIDLFLQFIRSGKGEV
jgi:AcrR family transcriptional regulator